MLNSEIRNSVEGHFSPVTVEPPTDWYLNFCTESDTKLVNNTQQSINVVLEPLLVAPALLAGSVFCSNLETINVLKYSNNPTVRAPETGHNFNRNDPDLYKCLYHFNIISNNNKRQSQITSRRWDDLY